jgi:PAS domain S-box-containing protein
VVELHRVGEDGEIELVIGTGLDLRAQLQLEAAVDALSASEARYSGIVSIAADAIISVDESQHITLFNGGAEEIFGWTAEEVVGKPLDLLIPERFRHAHRETHVPSFAASPVPARRMGERREIFGLRSNGEEFPAEASISKLIVGGKRVHTVVLRDVSMRKRLEAAQTFLLDAGLVLSSSLDYATTLRQVARLAVERLADFCIIDIVSPDGRIERLETAHGDPGLADIATSLQGAASRPQPARTSTAEALRSRRSWLVPDVTSELIEELSQSPLHRELLEALRPISYMAVPLIVRDQLLGALVLLSSSAIYGPDDLAIADELARRAALAIDQARLYEEAQRAIVARDDVVGIVAHDLGNPISAIRVGTSLLLRGLSGGGCRRHRETPPRRDPCVHGADGTADREPAGSAPHRERSPHARSPVAFAAACASRSRCSAAAMFSRVRSTASGVTEMESMPRSTSQAANSGYTDGAWPQIEQGMPARWASLMMASIAASTAPSRSSNVSAMISLSRSTPRTSCVRSFEPMDTPVAPSRAYVSSQ